MYLSGMGLSKVARLLTLEGIKPLHGEIWSRSAISDILKNEKYTGNMLLQKTYHEDFRTKRAIKNRGERRQYYVENSHEPIVNQQVFQQVQNEIERRT